MTLEVTQQAVPSLVCELSMLLLLLLLLLLLVQSINPLHVSHDCIVYCQSNCWLARLTLGGYGLHYCSRKTV